MKRQAAFFLALALSGAAPASAQQRVSLALSNPALGQPAPSPSVFQSLASGFWRTARQAAGSLIPAVNFIPDQGPAPAPPALPPSLLPQSGQRFSQTPASALPGSSPAAGGEIARAPGRALRPGSAVLPGGIIPLRASQAEPMAVLHRRPLDLTAKAEALRDPLRNLEHLSAISSDAGAERALRAGRQISEIVTDDASGAGAGAAMPGPEAGQAMGDAELDSLRDAVAQPPIPGAAAAEGVSKMRAIGAEPRAAASAAKFMPGLGEAVDAASTYDGQAGLGGGMGPGASASSLRPAQRRLDLALLILHVFDSAVRFSRAGKKAVSRRLRGLGLLGPDAPAPGDVAVLIAPKEPPTYALGSRGPAAGPEADSVSPSGAAGSASGIGGSQNAVFELPGAAGLPRRMPLPLAAALLLPLIGVALFFLGEARR